MSKTPTLWGIWTGKGWIRTNSGRDFKTDKKDFAESAKSKLEYDGARGLKIKEYEV